MSADDIAALLAFDPLGQAERLTGESYKDDGATMSLGFAMHMEHNRRKADALQAARDSHFAMNLAETLALYAEMGFAEVLCDEFAGTDVTETFHILWHPEGLLATVESYGGVRRNCSKVYYNIAMRSTGDMWSRTSSGRLMPGDVWVGDHDAREGIRTNLDRLREVGDFLPAWVERPFLWFVTYAETKRDYDYAAINAERISRLPAHVIAAIRGGDE